MEKMEMNRRLVKLLETYTNDRPLREMEHEELLSLIGWHLDQGGRDELFVINMLRECL